MAAVSRAIGAQAVPRHYPGFDILRILAIALVTAQHGLTLIGHEASTWWFGVSIGQVGVGLFCGVAGFLAFQSNSPPNRWLWKRLTRLFPAFWVVMIVAFILTGISGRKPFDATQVLCQMLGIGYFTHGYHMVNLVTWFISLILLCYVIAYVGRLAGRPRLIMTIAALSSAGLMAFHIETGASRHVITFAVAALAGMLTTNTHRAMLLVGGVVLLAGYPLHDEFALGAVVLPIMAGSLWVSTVMPRWIKAASDHVYEYYLLHGMTLAAAAGLVTKLWGTGAIPSGLAIGLGVAIAAVGAIGLRWGVAYVTDRIAGVRTTGRPVAAQ